MRGILIALLAMGPGAAIAQQTTTCNAYTPGVIQCDTRPSAPLSIAPTDYYGQLTPPQPMDAGLRAYQDAKARSRQTLISQVAPLMAAGQCETARLMAVQQRDAEIADLIARTCKPQ